MFEREIPHLALHVHDFDGVSPQLDLGDKPPDRIEQGQSVDSTRD